MLAGLSAKVRRVNKYRQRVSELGVKESLRRIYKTGELVYLRGEQVGKDNLGNMCVDQTSRHFQLTPFLSSATMSSLLMLL